VELNFNKLRGKKTANPAYGHDVECETCHRVEAANKIRNLAIAKMILGQPCIRDVLVCRQAAEKAGILNRPTLTSRRSDERTMGQVEGFRAAVSCAQITNHCASREKTTKLS
jgi:hypothetical protein